MGTSKHHDPLGDRRGAGEEAVWLAWFPGTVWANWVLFPCLCTEPQVLPLVHTIDSPSLFSFPHSLGWSWGAFHNFPYCHLPISLCDEKNPHFQSSRPGNCQGFEKSWRWEEATVSESKRKAQDCLISFLSLANPSSLWSLLFINWQR